MRDRIGGGMAAGVVALLSGVVAAFAPPSPTGRPAVDTVLTGVAVGVATLTAGYAPWSVIVVLAAVAVAAGAAAPVVAVAVVGLAVTLLLAWRRIDAPAARAVAAAIALNGLAWAELPGFFGLTSIIGVGAGVVVFLIGSRGLPIGVRRSIYGVGALATIGAVVGVAALGLSARRAQDDLEAGRDAAEAGIDALERGELDAAADQFGIAAGEFRRASDRVRSPVAGVAGLVPVAAQHRAAIVELSDRGADATSEVASAVGGIDPDTMRLVEGRIDIAAVAALVDPLRRVDGSLRAMSAAIDDTGSPWLIDSVTDSLDGLNDELVDRRPLLSNAIRAAELAPQLLGGDGKRTYLLLFATPSEARGIGGFVGNYGQLEIDDGRITMPTFGRVRDLEVIGQQRSATISGPAEYLARYADFCCGGDPNGRVGDAAWRNITATPHFPWVGEVAVDLYRQETGVELDGVMLVDPYVVQTMLRYTGPVELPSVGVTINGRNAAEFLLRDQYEFTVDANDERIDALEEAASGTFQQALSGDLPDPVKLVQDLSPLVEQRRLLMWTIDEDERAFLDDVGLLGAMPPLLGGDGWSVALNNAGGNKIDAFVERAVHYESEVTADGTTVATLRLELTNSAPSTGLPNYVIGNLVGLPTGTSRTYVSFYTALDVSTATADGAPMELTRGTEAGWNVYAAYVDIPSGDTAALELRLVGDVAEPGRLTTWEQPLASPQRILD